MNRVLPIMLALSCGLVAFAVFLFAGFQYGEPVWLLEPVVMLFAAGFALSLLIPLGLFGLARMFGQQGRFVLLAAFALTGVLLASLLAVYLVTGADVSRRVLAYETLLVVVLVAFNAMSFINGWIKAVANVALFAVAIAPSLTPASLSSFEEMVVGSRSVDFDDSTRFVISSRHDLKVTNHQLFGKRLEQGGGGFSLIDQDRVLIGSAYGDFYDVTLVDGEAHPTQTAIKAPLNRSDYQTQAKHPTGLFRVTDILLLDGEGPERTLLASHHAWNVEDKCLTLRLSETAIDLDDLASASPEWRTRFESQPCIPAPGLTNHNGGRLEYLTPRSILMSVGSHEYEKEAESLAAFDASSYGKIYEIDLDDWSASVFSSGHRNPQGLYVGDDVVWATEHGPQGGDELNVLRRDDHYGWPRSTYGTEYGQRQWPMNVGPGPHEVGRKPVHAWVPSIGVSNLLQISGEAFPGWRGDLIVGSLNGASGDDTGRSLYRVAVDGERAIFAERMYTGQLVRDLVERDDGTLLLWDGLQYLQTVEPTTHVFSACAGCHGIRDGGTHGIGPDLLGITGDKVASRKDYDYSEALRDFGGRWTTERLDAYLRDPDGVVPGTTMAFPGIEDPALRAEIIEYLAKAEQ